jgi:hypothetical protein
MLADCQRYGSITILSAVTQNLQPLAVKYLIPEKTEVVPAVVEFEVAHQSEIW